ncbi:hypothetical protein ZIOFF_001766 [Zingiber officinale]|uniref:Uncharacterized protein n=1 Tax=Zingiber officinale TaxID=94328 RepID=A0A8J5I443_ZINOF|nr:hypothetical protein ZIOFF_001766 [Zingiber officinale]
MILGLQSIAAERPLGSSTAQAGSNHSDRMEDDKPPLLGRLVNSLPKNGSNSHAWSVFLVITYKSGSIITSALKKHKMSCFGCCEENDNNRTAASGGPYVASHSAGNDGAYLSANTPSKGAQTVKPQPITVPAIPFDEIREITKNFGDEALIWEGSFGRVYFVSMVSRLKHENVVELVSYGVEGNLRLLAYEFATMGSVHDILHEAVRKEPTIEKPTPVSAPPKDAERKLSKKELKKKEMAELDALLHEMGIANKDNKKQLEQSSEGEKKESVGAPSENRILKKKKSKKEKSSKEQEEHYQNQEKGDIEAEVVDASAVDVKERIKKVASMRVASIARVNLSGSNLRKKNKSDVGLAMLLSTRLSVSGHIVVMVKTAVMSVREALKWLWATTCVRQL